MFNRDELIKTIHKICSMPRDFHLLENVSMVQLTKESGYLRFKDDITKDRIIETLKEQPDFIDDWLRYSDNERTSTGWYFFRRKDEGKWVVGYHDGISIKGENEKSFVDKFEACATYILIKVKDFSNNVF